jgi:DNA mismatch endonuclease, patch repair protein
VHGLGYRYRLHRKDLPGKPDLVFGPKRKVIFVHGCFWHGHDRQGCPGVGRPKTNTTFWDAKLKSNRQRDAQRFRQLNDLGWDVLTIWECEIPDVSDLCKRLKSFLR